MRDEDRGKIRNREYAQQIRDFSGLRFGKITPTDIDGFTDFGDRLFIFLEGKHGDSAMSYGQKLAFERLVDACNIPGTRASVGLVFRHDCGSDDVAVADCVVTNIRFNGKWFGNPSGETVRQLMDNAHAHFIQGGIQLGWDARQLEIQIARAADELNSLIQSSELFEAQAAFQTLQELIAQRTPETVKALEVAKGMWG